MAFLPSPALGVLVFLLFVHISVFLLLLVIWYLPGFGKFSERWVLARLPLDFLPCVSSGQEAYGNPLCEVRALSLPFRSLFDPKWVPASPGSSHPRNQHGRLFRIHLTPQLSSSGKIWAHVVMLVSIRSLLK